MTTKHYHLTEEANLTAILKEGLKPQLGPRSKSLGENRDAVYLFSNLEDLETALESPWGEIAWNEEDDLAILEVIVPESARLGADDDAGFEVSCLDHIPAENIKLVRIEPGLDPDEPVALGI